MKILKKILSMIMVLLLIVGIVPVSAVAEDIDETYTLTLVYNHGVYGDVTVDTSINDVVVENIPSGTTVDLSNYWPDDLSVTGNDGKTYYFCNFLTNPTGGATYCKYEIKSDITLYAGWVTSKLIAVTFDAKGGSMDYKKAMCQADMLGGFNSLYAPVRNGYKFLGWSLDDDGTADDSGIEITENCTLYAVWEQEQQASTHSHCVCGGNTDIGDHTTHTTDQVWQPTDTLPTAAGYYYLTSDITLTECWEPVDGVYLCLNGKVVNQSVEKKNAIWLHSANGSLTLTDCSLEKHTFSVGEDGVWELDANGDKALIGGVITGAKGMSGICADGKLNVYKINVVGNRSVLGGGLMTTDRCKLYGVSVIGNFASRDGGGIWASYATLDIYESTISQNSSLETGGGIEHLHGMLLMRETLVENNTTSEAGGGVYVEGLFEMEGGSIKENSSRNSTGGGVWIHAYSTPKISGDAVIADNTGKDGTNNLHLASDGTTDAKITIGELGNNASIGVSVDSNHGMIISDGGKDYKDKFFSDDGAYAVAVDGDNLRLEAHNHNCVYSADRFTVTESCTLCNHEATAEIVDDFISPAIYSGTAYGAKVVYSDNWVGNKPTQLRYYKESVTDGNLVSECRDAGRYWAVIEIEGETVQRVFTINTKAPEISVKPTASKILVNSTLSNVDLNGGMALGVGGVELTGSFSWKEPAVVMSTLGSQTLKVVFKPDDKNYYVHEFEIEVEVVVCNTPSGEHEYIVPAQDDSDHWNKCSGCDAIDLKIKHSGTDDGDCETGLSCSCGYILVTAESHCFDDACDTDCNNTGCTYTRTTSHTPNADDGDCTTAVHCSVCDEVTTEACAAHSGGTATCEAKAKCSECGKEYGDAGVHNYENGKCKVCGIADPNYKPTSPQTGDNSNMALWLALLFVSGMGVVATTVYGRKKKTN